MIGISVRLKHSSTLFHVSESILRIYYFRGFASSVCSCGGGSAQRQNVCDTPSNDTIPDRYLPIGLMTEGKKSQSPYCVEHYNISVLCMGEARAPKWLKRKAERCKKGM